MHNTSIRATEFACLQIASILSFQAKKKNIPFFFVWNVERGAGAQLPIHSFWLNSLRLLLVLQRSNWNAWRARTHICTTIVRHLHVYAGQCVWHTKSNGEERRLLDRVVAECWQRDRDAHRKAGLFTEILKCSTNTLPRWGLCVCVCVVRFFAGSLCFFHLVRSDFKFQRKSWFPVAFHPLVWVGHDGQDSDRWYFPFCLESIAFLFLCPPDARAFSKVFHFQSSVVDSKHAMHATAARPLLHRSMVELVCRRKRKMHSLCILLVCIYCSFIQ